MVIISNDKAEHFCTIFQNIKLMSEYISLSFQSNGLYVQGMDGSHVSMYEIYLDKGWFNSYEVNVHKLISITSSILQKTLASRTANQSIEIDIDKDNAFIIHFKSETKSRVFTIPLIDIDSSIMNVPEHEYDVNIFMQSKIFKNEIDEMLNFSETIKITCEKDRFLLTINDHECSCETTFLSSTCRSYETECETSATFSLKIMQIFTKFFRLSTDIHIRISDNCPLLMEYGLDDASYIKLYLAPKINEGNL
jgi:proliferating cell nuclear antigen